MRSSAGSAFAASESCPGADRAATSWSRRRRTSTGRQGTLAGVNSRRRLLRFESAPPSRSETGADLPLTGRYGEARGAPIRCSSVMPHAYVSLRLCLAAAGLWRLPLSRSAADPAASTAWSQASGPCRESTRECSACPLVEKKVERADLLADTWSRWRPTGRSRLAST